MITYPLSIKSKEFAMHINDDDMTGVQAGAFADFLKSKGFEVTRSKKYSSTKCMAWFVFKYKKEDTYIRSFGENIKMSERMLQMFLALC